MVLAGWIQTFSVVVWLAEASFDEFFVEFAVAFLDALTWVRDVAFLVELRVAFFETFALAKLAEAFTVKFLAAKRVAFLEAFEEMLAVTLLVTLALLVSLAVF